MEGNIGNSVSRVTAKLSKISGNCSKITIVTEQIIFKKGTWVAPKSHNL